MASLPNSRTITYKEWLRMPEGSGEVVNGQIRTVSPPWWNHTDVVQRLHSLASTQTDEREVTVVSSEFGLTVRLQPAGDIHSAPQLAVEVLSPANTRRERAEKLEDYSSLGIPEVWVISPEARTVEILYLEDSQLRRHAILAEGILKPRHFPDVQINIAEIWPD